jgi:hypothetical protein
MTNLGFLTNHSATDAIFSLSGFATTQYWGTVGGGGSLPVVESLTNFSFSGLAGSALFVSKGLLIDGLGLLTRPVVLAGFLNGAALFAERNLFDSVVGSGSTILIVLSLCTICPQGLHKPSAALASSCFVIDATLQLPQLLFPYSQSLILYPMPQTGVFTMAQLLGSADVFFTILEMNNAKRCVGMLFSARSVKLTTAISFRYISMRLQAQDPTYASGAVFVYGAACICFGFAISPQSAWDTMIWLLQQATTYAASFFSAVYSFITQAYLLIQQLWPRIKAFIWSLIRHPFIATLHRIVVEPVWRITTPWLLPFSTATVVVSCGAGAMAAFNAQELLLATALTCAASAAIASTAVLLLDAVAVIFGGCFADPLQSTFLTLLLSVIARAISFPWILFDSLSRAVNSLVQSCFSLFFVRAIRFAVKVPLVSIPCVLGLNYMLYSSSLPLKPALDVMLVPSNALCQWGRHGIARLIDAPFLADAPNATISRITDFSFTITIICAFQVAAFRVASRLLYRLQISPAALNREEAVLSGEELNDIAATFTDPRQCGFCCFGPVDHYRCSDLRSNHQEGGSSNACPQCGWFSSRLSDWPPWDSLMRSAGHSVLTKLTWNELIIAVRASSKGLVIPYALLHLGKTVLGLPPSLAAFLAFSYLLPWGYENASTLNELSRSTWRRLEEEDYFRRRQQEASRQRRTAAPVAIAAVTDATSCGADRSEPIDRANVEPSDALAAILQNIPDRVFLAPGEVCPVCLDEFDSAASDCAASLRGADAAGALQGLTPPVVALRCGHPLHVACAEAAVSNAGNRHMRCPLCREPATLMGATSARLFT